MTPVTVLSLRRAYEALPKLPAWDGFLRSRNEVGERLRAVIEETRARPGVGTVLIDLAGVQAITTSVAGEIGPHALRAPGAPAAYLHVTPRTQQHLGAAFGGSRRAALAYPARGERPVLLGDLPPALRAVVDAVIRGERTAAALEAGGVEAASRKLHELAHCFPGLLTREKRPSGQGPRAWEYVYRPAGEEHPCH